MSTSIRWQRTARQSQVSVNSRGNCLFVYFFLDVCVLYIRSTLFLFCIFLSTFSQVILIGELFFQVFGIYLFCAIFQSSIFSWFFSPTVWNFTNLIFLLLENFTNSDRTPPYIDTYLQLFPNFGNYGKKPSDFLIFFQMYVKFNDLDFFPSSGEFHEERRNASEYWYMSPITSKLWKLW